MKHYKHYKCGEGQTCTFQILFTSDVHGAFRDYSYSLDKETPTSGFSKIATLMRHEKDSFDGQTFIVDVGDIIQGNGTGLLVHADQSDPPPKINPEDYRPFPLLAAYDALGYDMVALGNHEFNFGVDTMLKAFKGFKGEKLCGNVFLDEDYKTLLEGFKAYTVKTLESGLRVAFIGMVTPNITAWDKKNLEGFYVQDAATATSRVMAHIKDNNEADVIILLAHMHTCNELGQDGSGAEAVANANPGIDLFLGAHFHTRVGTKDNQYVLGDKDDVKVKFAENVDSAKTYGRARVTATFENGGWHVKNRIGSYESSDVKTHIIAIENDPAVEKATQKAHEDIQDYMRNTIIGKLEGEEPLVPEPLIKGTNSAVLQPTPLLHLFSKVMLKYSGAKIAAVSLNSYDANCLPGDISLGAVARMYVYDSNTIYRMKMTGKQIKKWMEWSHEFFGPLGSDGKIDRSRCALDPKEDLTIPYGARKIYLHDKFAGINYSVDLTQPAGSRITVLDKWFKLDETYLVATTSYRANSNLTIHDKDGVFSDPNENVAVIDTMDVKSPMGKINMLDWIVEYIKDSDGKITSEVENNWSFINLDWDEKLRLKAIGQINDGTIPYDFTKPVKKTDIL